jgi:hypothetical protein
MLKKQSAAARSPIELTENSQNRNVKDKEIAHKESSCNLKYFDLVSDEIKSNLFERVVFSVNDINSQKIA